MFIVESTFQSISGESSLKDLGVGESVLHIRIWVSFPKVQLLRSETLQLPKPDSKTPLRPPGAFGVRIMFISTFLSILSSCNQLVMFRFDCFLNCMLTWSLVLNQKRKDLTGMDGHLLLLEYMEENPLLIGYPGRLVRVS